MTAYNGEDENLMADRRPTLDPQERNHQAREFLTRLAIDLDRAGKPNDARACEAIVDDILLPAYRPATVSSADLALAASPPSPAVVPSKWKLVPVDDETREFANSALPVGMIHAGMDVLEKVNEDNVYYTACDTIDWDNGMVAVAVYRAMLAASPAAPALDGAGRDAVIEECAKVADAAVIAAEQIGTRGLRLTRKHEARRIAAAIRSLKETP